MLGRQEVLDADERLSLVVNKQCIAINFYKTTLHLLAFCWRPANKCTQNF